MPPNWVWRENPSREGSRPIVTAKSLPPRAGESDPAAEIPSLRVLMLNSTPVDVFGGVEQWMLRSAAGLTRRGHSVHVMGRRGSLFLERLVEAGIPVHPGRSGTDFDPLRTLHIAWVATRTGSQLVIVNYNKEMTQAALARRISPIRKIIGRSVAPMMDTGPRHRRFYSKHLDGLITPSREVKRVVEDYSWMKGTRVQNIPNGVDLSRVDRAAGRRAPERKRLGFSPDQFIVGAIGRLEEHKGFQHLIEAFGMLAKEVEGAGLVLVGSGSWEPELRRQAEELGAISSQIHFTGHLDNVDTIYPAFDTVVLPSTTSYETFGQSLVEAMAFYVPVVGSRVGGIPEIITEGENGFLVPPGDAETLARTLVKLAGDRELRHRLSRTGRRTVEQYFREDTMLDRLELYLAEMLRTP